MVRVRVVRLSGVQCVAVSQGRTGLPMLVSPAWADWVGQCQYTTVSQGGNTTTLPTLPTLRKYLQPVIHIDIVTLL